MGDGIVLEKFKMLALRILIVGRKKTKKSYALPLSQDNERTYNQTKKMVEKYKHWDVLEILPIGWKIDNSTGSPLHGYDFCTDGKSILNGGKRALVRSIKKGTPRIKFVEPKEQIKEKKPTKDENYIFPAKAVNTLARKRFLEHLLRDIQVDLMICELEGWDKKEYIKEIKSLINSINLSSKKSELDTKQLKVFAA